MDPEPDGKAATKRAVRLMRFSLSVLIGIYGAYVAGLVFGLCFG